MARTDAILTPTEVLLVNELDTLANNSVIYKDNAWVINAISLWANTTVLTSNWTTSAPTFQAWGWGGWITTADAYIANRIFL